MMGTSTPLAIVNLLDNHSTVLHSVKQGLGDYEFSVLVKAKSFLCSALSSSVAEDKMHARLMARAIEKYDTTKKDWEWKFILRMSQTLSDDRRRLFITGKCELLEILRELDPGMKIKLALDIYEPHRSYSYYAPGSEYRLEMGMDMISLSSDGLSFDKEATTFCKGETDDYKLVALLSHTRNELPGKASLWYSRHSDKLPVFPTLPVPDPMVVCKTILKDSLHTDLIITIKNGHEFHCHKSFLTAQSEPFTAMFERDCIERETSNVKIEDLDDDGAKAFLAFLYFWNLTAAESSSHVAVQLLTVGYKYMIVTLQEAMRKVLLQKSNDWYELDDALEMFIVAHEIEMVVAGGDHALIQKLIQVIRSKSNGICTSAAFQTLFRTCPDLALKFCEAAISY